jgi:hypothetical protein
MRARISSLLSAMESPRRVAVEAAFGHVLRRRAFEHLAQQRAPAERDEVIRGAQDCMDFGKGQIANAGGMEDDWDSRVASAAHR